MGPDGCDLPGPPLYQNPLLTLNGQKVGSGWLVHAETGERAFAVGDSVKLDPSHSAEDAASLGGVLQTLAAGTHLVVEKITCGDGGPDDKEVMKI